MNSLRGVSELKTLVELLRYRAAAQPDLTVYRFLADGENESATMTFRQLDEQARAIAAWLQHEGAAGERALLLYAPGLEFISAFFGCLYAGVAPAPLAMTRPKAGLDRLEAIQCDMDARFALTTAALLPDFLESVSEIPKLAAARWQASDEIDAGCAGKWRDAGLTGESLAYLQYTSGSTDLPRGVMVSHGNLLHNMAYIDEAFEHTPESVSVTWLPHFHDMGLIYGLLQPVYNGFRCIVMPPAAFTQRPARWPEAISKYGATHSGGPNFSYDLCVKATTPEQRAELDLSSWGIAFNGAEAVHRETLDRFAWAFAASGFSPAAFYPAYGLAEATLKVSGGRKGGGAVFFAAQSSALARNRVVAADGDDEAKSMVGCGQASCGTEIVIVDPESLTRCEPDEVGEIWVSNPSIAQGYWRRPEETERVFGGRLATGEGPYLRTGDLGFLRHGELYIAGRLKDVIIIRGQNHHPSDIEMTAIGAHDDLRLGGAAAFSVDVEGDERLAIVVEADRRDPDIAELGRAVRRAVAEQHELQCYAVVVIRKGAIPKTSSGKIQRRLAKTRYLNGELDVLGESVVRQAAAQADVQAPTRETLLAAQAEERPALAVEYLLGQFARTLGIPAADIDPQRPVTAYGLDSLMAMELKNRVESELRVAIAAVSLLKGASLAELAAAVAQAVQSEAAPADAPVVRTGDLPLSFEQERLWLLDRISPGNAAYHVPFAFRMKGALDGARFEKSVNEMIRRHETLRTSLPEVNGKPAQVIANEINWRLSVVDLREVPEAEQEHELRELANNEARRRFDLARAPLFRLKLYRLTDEEHVAALTMHHTISDVWSLGLFVKELVARYAGEAPAALPLQYADFALRQRQELPSLVERHAPFWNSRLANAPTLDLPGERPRPANPTFRGATVPFAFPQDLAAAIQQFTRREHATLFTALLAGFEALLARFTKQTDIVVGCTIANRNRPGLESLIGFFATPLPVRTDLAGDPDFRGVLGRVRDAALEAYEHQELPFAKVVEAARPGRQSTYTPLFNVLFGLVKSPLADAADAGLQLSAVDLDAGMTDFDFVVNIVEEGDGLRGVFTYGADVWTEETVGLLIRAYIDLLEAAVRAPETPLARLPLPAPLDARRKAPAQDARPQIAITSTFTAEPVEGALRLWLEELDLPYRIRFAPYNQVFQQLLDAGSLVSMNAGVNVMLVRPEDWVRFDGANGDWLAKLEENARALVEALKAAAGRTASPFVLAICPASPERAGAVARIEEMLAGAPRGIGSLHLVTSAELAETYPVPVYYDPHADKLGHMPFTPEFYAALGTMLARKIHALQRSPYKAIALDCDQTLWQGVCGEDGPHGVVVDEARRRLQEFMLAQHDAGMLLCLCTKNNEEDALGVFDCRNDMPLRRDHFVSWRINWGSKSENLRSLAEELGIGLDAFIFVDDNPTECAEVQANCPDVLTLQLPSDPADVPAFLKHVWAFDHLNVTAEDRSRTAMYAQRVERARFQKQAVSLEEFLAGLNLEIDIRPMAKEQLPRVSQLTRRTNQMNSSAIRRSEAEIEELLRCGFECLTVNLTDRFGSYGLVGVMLYETVADALRVDTFLLSCRALGRGVEHRMLARLGAIAQERGLSRVDVPFVPTGKNRPACEFLTDAQPESPIGPPAEMKVRETAPGAAQPGSPAAPRGSAGAASKCHEDQANKRLLLAGIHQLRWADGPCGTARKGCPTCVFRFSAERAAALVYKPQAKPVDAQPAGAAAARRTTAASIDYVRIANELRDASQIAEKVRAQARNGTTGAAGNGHPRTPVEKRLAALWADLLGVPEVGIYDNFFDLGGHSLLAVQLLSRVREEFHADLSLNVVFTGAFTVAELAKHIEVREIEDAGGEEYGALLDELEQLSDEEVRALIAQESDENAG